MTELVFNRRDDEITYRISAQRLLRRRTVQVTVSVELLVGPDVDEPGRTSKRGCARPSPASCRPSGPPQA